MNDIKWTVLKNATVEWSVNGDTNIDLEIRGYCDRHTLIGFKSEADLYSYIMDKLNGSTESKSNAYFKIKKVHFNPPATVVLWADGTKTVVKVQDGDVFDPEKGLAMAISKKALGNKGNFNEVFKKWVDYESYNVRPKVALNMMDIEEVTISDESIKALQALADRIYNANVPNKGADS